jgi:hypothetical protein
VDLKRMCSIVLEKYQENVKTFKEMDTNWYCFLFVVIKKRKTK